MSTDHKVKDLGLADWGRREIKIADQLLHVESGGIINPAEWPDLAQQAATIREQVVRDLRVRNAYEQTMTAAHEAEHHVSVDLSAGPQRPEIGL